MRTFGTLKIPDEVVSPPDVVQTFLLAAGVGQAQAWPNSTGGAAANADTVGQESQIARLTFCSTLGIPMLGMVNLLSTLANAPTSGSSATTSTTVGSTGNSLPVPGSRFYQVPSYSTGYSVAAPAAGYCLVEIWKR